LNSDKLEITKCAAIILADLIDTRRVSAPVAMTIAMVIVTFANALIAQRP
jgi:hypothetical protein